MARLISGRYADAFFSLAQETGKLDTFFDEAVFMHESLSSDEELLKVIAHPDIVGEEKLSIIKNIFEDKVSEEFISLIRLMFRKNRESEICGVLKAFIDKVLDYKGITTAFVYSAAALSESQLTAIKDKLSANLNKQVNIETQIDKSLIGGVKISVDGHVIDGTLKKQLGELKGMLLATRLNGGSVSLNKA